LIITNPSSLIDFTANRFIPSPAFFGPFFEVPDRVGSRLRVSFVINIYIYIYIYTNK